MQFEDVFFWIFGPVLITWIISCLVFARLSMARIERAIVAEGHPRPCEWDMQGMRIVTYALVIVAPYKWVSRPEFRRLMDPDLVRPHATPADRMRARLFITLLSIMLLTGAIGFFGLELYKKP